MTSGHTFEIDVSVCAVILNVSFDVIMSAVEITVGAVDLTVSFGAHLETLFRRGGSLEAQARLQGTQRHG